MRFAQFNQGKELVAEEEGGKSYLDQSSRRAVIRGGRIFWASRLGNLEKSITLHNIKDGLLALNC